MQRYLHHVRAHAYTKILSEVPLRQPEDGQYMPKHVVFFIIQSFNTPHVTQVFDYVPFSKQQHDRNKILTLRTY